MESSSRRRILIVANHTAATPTPLEEVRPLANERQSALTSLSRSTLGVPCRLRRRERPWRKGGEESILGGPMADKEPPRRGRDIDYGKPLSAAAVRKGRHRRRVGGQWEELGSLQADFMIAQGLRPGHRLLDVGCGALRAGNRFVDYLEPGDYYGIDINQTLLDAGYEEELSGALRQKLPRDHLRATDRFDCDFGVVFDFAIAHSLFTHISLNHIRLCLFRVAKVMAPGGRLLASYFQAPPAHPVDEPRAEGRLWTERNAFFYYRRDLRYAAQWAPWDVRYMGEWGHPRQQRMMEFRRIEGPPPRERRDAPERQTRGLPKVFRRHRES